ncbi:MAG: crotonase/enoyl-CoA hydratase family protein [Acidimicrobiia bacterium]
MTDHTCFALDIADQVAHLRMIRPERANSMIPEFWRELPAIVNRLSDEAGARVLVLSAEGRHFCSGMDTTVFTNPGGIADASKGGGRSSRARVADTFRAMAMDAQESFTALERARLPILCAIQGACVGGGVDMVTAADLRYATEDAFFCIQEINIGMTADVGTLQRLPKLIPPGIVAELAYTGRRMPAAQAKAYGLVNEVYPDHATMLEAVLATAREIASKSPLAVWGTKRTMQYAREHSTADGLEHIATWNASMLDPADMAEAFTAQLEKREPAYPDLYPVRRGFGA